MKQFRLTPEQIQPVAVGFGSCLASDRITVDGMPVGYMYRENPHSEWDSDSGWRFFGGDESQEYSDDASHFALYDVNTIANYDPSITEFLEAPPGSAFARNADGVFVPEEPPVDPDA